ncbi:MAG: hypothetical protein PSV13_09700 [Lacunisphaera sp.]|nr:hypothetical protein [Lacunisphaera sp.]
MKTPQLTRLLLAAFVGGMAGCTSPAPAPGPAAAAAAAAESHLVVTNLTDYEWNLVIAPAAGGEGRTSRVPPRGSLTIDLAGGDYLIDQSALPAGAAPELSRRLPVRLAAGKAYRWRLGTLLSDAAGAPMSPANRSGP